MADLFSDLVGEVQGAAPQITPLLPPLFAPWPGIPFAGAEPPPPEQAGASAQAANPGGFPGDLQSGLPVDFQDGSQSSSLGGFPPPLVDPNRPAAQAPLPTFRQMVALQPRPEPPFQPGQEQAAPLPAETAGFEPGHPSQDPGRPEHAAPQNPRLDSAQVAPPPSPTLPAAVIQPFSDSNAPRHPPAASSAGPDAWPSPTGEPGPAQSRLPDFPALPEQLTSPAPEVSPQRPVFPAMPAAPAAFTASAASAATAAPAVTSTHSPRAAEANPTQARSEPVEKPDRPGGNRPEPVEPRPEDTPQPPILARRDSQPFTAQSLPAAPALIPAKGQVETVETGLTSIEKQPVAEPPVAEPRHAPAARPPELISSQGKPVENLEQPVEPAQMTAEGQPEPHETGYTPNPRQTAEAQGQAKPGSGPALLAEARLAPPALQKGRDMFPPGQPEIMAPLPAPAHLPPAQVESQVQPLPRHHVDAPNLPTGRAVAPPALALTENLPAQGIQTQPAPAGEPVQPAAQADASGVPPDASGAPPAEAAPRAAAAPTRAAGAREPVLLTRRTLSPEREPEILPVPEPAQSGKRQTDALADAKSPPPPAARAAIDQPAPTVRVTIGRVVVRASLPAADPPSKRVDLPRPLLSLDHYLKGKKGGEA